MGLGYIWLEREGRYLKDVYQITKTRCNNIERKSSRDKMKEMKSPSSLCYMKTEWAENCIEIDVIWMTELG
jgi:hypothetical protein